jgi:hypothetical protein
MQCKSVKSILLAFCGLLQYARRDVDSCRLWSDRSLTVKRNFGHVA